MTPQTHTNMNKMFHSDWDEWNKNIQLKPRNELEPKNVRVVEKEGQKLAKKTQKICIAMVNIFDNNNVTKLRMSRAEEKEKHLTQIVWDAEGKNKHHWQNIPDFNMLARHQPLSCLDTLTRYLELLCTFLFTSKIYIS